MSPTRYRVETQAFDSADEWHALLPAAITVAPAGVPIQVLLEALRERGVECRLVKTSRGGDAESHLLDRKTAHGNSQAAIDLIPLA